MAKQKTSVKALVRDARQQDHRLRSNIMNAIRRGKSTGDSTVDSFVNMAYKMGVGADNPTSFSSYGFNPITRNRTMLEWMHRGSWICGLAIDIPADDMTKNGIYFTSEMEAADTQRIDMAIKGMQIWPNVAEVIRWGRLYGGCLGVALIEGQDMRTPLRPETVGVGQFKGIMPLDRWMVEPSLQDLVDDMGPFMGQPRYYTVQANAPALRGVAIHHSRVAFRHVGIPLPYQQALMENLWGISVLERMFDRLVGFDSATAGVTQLVYKAYIRTLKVKDLRKAVANGNAAMEGLMRYVENMRRWTGPEGITMVDSEDELSMDTHQAFSGLDDVLVHLGQQVSGALQIPLVRLFGQSPAGLNSTGESDLRTYYDYIAQQQEKHLQRGVLMIYYLTAKSLGIEVPDDFALEFSSLYELNDDEKADVAGKVATAVTTAHDNGLLTDKAAMQELRQSSRVTGIFTNISRENIDAADDTVTDVPGVQGLLGGLAGHVDPNSIGAEGGDQEQTGLPGGAADQAGTVLPFPRSRVRLQ